MARLSDEKFEQLCNQLATDGVRPSALANFRRQRRKLLMAGFEDRPYKPRPKGFAAMSPEKQREIAKLGGRAAHERGTAHKWTSQEASQAGRKGGTATGKKRGKKL